MTTTSLITLFKTLLPITAIAAAPRRVRNLKAFLSDYQQYKAYGSNRFELSLEDLFPQLEEKTPTHSFDTHYIFHTAWAARIVAQNKPKVHVDISSSLYFAGIVSAFVPVDFYDYRPAQLGLDQLRSGHADLTQLHFKSHSLASLSCMHTVEHIGLGRYGDPINPDGDLRAMTELKRVLRKGGSLLFVVPVGRPTLRFNAHRIYGYDQIVSAFNGLTLKEFALVPDGNQAQLIRNATKKLADQQQYGCGCFWFTKP